MSETKYKCPQCKINLTKTEYIVHRALGPRNVNVLMMAAWHETDPYVDHSEPLCPEHYYCKKCGYIEQHLTDSDLYRLNELQDEGEASGSDANASCMEHNMNSAAECARLFGEIVGTRRLL